MKDMEKMPPPEEPEKDHSTMPPPEDHSTMPPPEDHSTMPPPEDHSMPPPEDHSMPPPEDGRMEGDDWYAEPVYSQKKARSRMQLSQALIKTKAIK